MKDDTVEVLVRIPKREFEELQSNYVWWGRHGEYIKKGTVLPKGHERLIAEPTEEDIAKTIGGQNDFAECIREAVKTVFDNAPTVIEADKEVQDGK